MIHNIFRHEYRNQMSEFPQFNFTTQYFDKSQIERTDLMPDNQCLVLYNVFSKDECQQLINQGEKHGFGHINESYHPNQRNNLRIIILNDQFKNELWNRIIEHVEDQLIINENYHKTLHTTGSTKGIWQKYALNERFRLCKYNPGNFFRKHYDDGFHPDFNMVRTMKTCMVYLNEEFEGGETIFYVKNGKNIDEIKLKPKTGMCLIFNQKILHEGFDVFHGVKYFIRTDIYYNRTSEYHKQELSNDQKSAIELYKKAIDLENDNNIPEATKYYISATKICADVYDLYELYQ